MRTLISLPALTKHRSLFLIVFGCLVLLAFMLLSSLSVEAQSRGGKNSNTCISWVQDTYIEGYSMQSQPGDSNYDGELQAAAAGGYSCNGGSCTRSVTAEYAYAQIDAGAEECSFGSTAPTVDLSATPATVYAGSASNLSWSSTNADSCTGTGFSTGGATSGSVSSGTLSANQNYVLTCTGAGGSASDTASVTVTQPPISASLTASPSSVSSGSSSVLSWTSSNAGSCIGTGFATNGATSGSAGTGSLAETTNYILTCVTQTGTSGTWQLRNTDTSDVSCPVTGNTNIYSTVPNCPVNPQGKNCASTGLSCKVNTNTSSSGGGGCFITSQLYACEGGTSSTLSAIDTATVSVTPANSPTASLSANPTSITSGGSSTLTWSSTNATSCTGTGFSTGGATSGSVSTGALTATTNYSVSCTGTGGTGTDDETVTVTGVQGPNLTASGVTPTSATEDSVVNLLATITNNGNTATGGGFTNLFQIDSDSDHNAVTATLTDTSPNLATSGNDVSQVSYTFASSGTWYVRACADNNTSWAGTVTETNENDNCGEWTPVSVAACSGVGCTGYPGTLSCSVNNANPLVGQTVTYTATPGGGATGPYIWTASDGAAGLGTAATASRTFPSPGIYTMNVSSATGANASCSPQVSVGCGVATASITASPTRVTKGSTATLTIPSLSGVDGTCTVTGPGVNRTFTAASCSVPATSFPTGAITTLSTYTLSCDGGETTAKVIVNVVPAFQEF